MVAACDRVLRRLVGISERRVVHFTHAVHRGGRDRQLRLQRSDSPAVDRIKWTNVVPIQGADDWFIGVSCTSERACIALVRSPYSPDIARWDGRKWSNDKVPNRDINLAAVSCTTTTSCVAVGGLHDGATSLISRRSPAPSRPGLG